MTSEIPKFNNQQLCEEISLAITPVIEAAGNYLEEVSTIPAGKSRIVTVIVDSDEHLNLDQVTSVTKDISDILDALPALGENPFTLEVTSPGVDRPLTKQRHWKKNRGRLVNLTMNDGALVSGRIGQLEDEFVLIGGEPVNLSQITKAIIEIEFKSLKDSSTNLGEES
jgi:ribosome maturation factor RimP